MNGEDYRGKIPAEILNFLRGKGGHSLLIKGKAGTGKTTLALQIIEELSDEQMDYYLSARIADESLYRQFPWLREKARRNEILKAGKTFLTKSRGVRAERNESSGVLKAAQELLKAFHDSDREFMVVRSELHKLEGQIESGEIDESEGEGYAVELDEGSLTFDLGVLLPEVELAYDLVEAHLPKKTMVVIDSIEALSEKYGISAQRIMNTMQKDLVEHSGTNLVYVMETWKDISLDYLGDGVVLLVDDEIDGRRVRYLIIEKLRGFRVDRWRYMFTLLNGRLKVFDPVPQDLLSSLEKHKPIKEGPGSFASLGSKHFDEVFRGLPRGSLTLIEIGRNVPQDVTRRMEFMVMSDFISKGRGVIWFPLHSVDYSILDAQMKKLMSSEQLSKCLRILDKDAASDRGFPFITVIEGSDVANDLRWNSLRYMLSESSSPYLSMLGFDALEAVYGPGVVRQVSGHLDAIRRSGNIALAEATSELACLTQLANQAQLHIRLESMNGAVMVCGCKPHTPYYNLEFQDGQTPRLIPML